MFRHGEACSPAPCVDGVAQEELLVMQGNLNHAEAGRKMLQG